MVKSMPRSTCRMQIAATIEALASTGLALLNSLQFKGHEYYALVPENRPAVHDFIYEARISWRTLQRNHRSGR